MIEEPSEEFCRAYDALWHADTEAEYRPDRHSVEAMLQQFADGNTDSEDLLFMRKLARCLLAAGGKSAATQRRADNVLRAAGLSGTYDNNREFVEHATQMAGFDGYTIAGGIRSAQASGLLSHIDEKDARRMIANTRKK